jgi:hypothetical protein
LFEADEGFNEVVFKINGGGFLSLAIYSKIIFNDALKLSS